MGTNLFDAAHLAEGLAFAVALIAAIAGVVLLPAFVRFAARYDVRTGWLGAGVLGGPSFATAGAATAAGAVAFRCPVGAACCGAVALAGVAAAAAGVRRTRATRRLGRDGSVIPRMSVSAGVWCPGYRAPFPGEQQCPVQLYHLGHRWHPGAPASAERVSAGKPL